MRCFFGLLRKSMYGHRDVPNIWQTFVKHMLEQHGFCRLVCTPCTFFQTSVCNAGGSWMTSRYLFSFVKIFRVGLTNSSNLVTG